MKRNHALRVGLVINPYAGIGGAVALRGSDGADTVTEAFARGATWQATPRAEQTLQALSAHKDHIQWVCYHSIMGADLARRMNFQVQEVGQLKPEQSAHQCRTTPNDTQSAVALLQDAGVDILVFVGGDGTARDICSVVSPQQPVLGIPAGVKVQSGVYAISPLAAASILVRLAQGESVELAPQSVRDLASTQLSTGRILPSHYGEMLVPVESTLIQQAKSMPPTDEDHAQIDIGDFVAQLLEDDRLYAIGPGSTTQTIMDALGLPNTLLGVDLVKNRQLIAADVTASELSVFSGQGPMGVVVTPIGGQGHVLGRGNQQLSAEFIRQIDKAHFHIVATPMKLAGLQGRPLWVDSGNPSLDRELAGSVTVITGFEQRVLYRLSSGGIMSS